MAGRGVFQGDQANAPVVQLSRTQQKRRLVASVDGLGFVCSGEVFGICQSLEAWVQTVFLPVAFVCMGRGHD